MKRVIIAVATKDLQNCSGLSLLLYTPLYRGLVFRFKRKGLAHSGLRNIKLTITRGR